MDRVDGKVAIVTGASSGFGRGIAKALAAEGARVVVSDVQEQPNAGGFEDDAAFTTAEAIQKIGRPGDLRRVRRHAAQSGRRTGPHGRPEYGRLDVIVNNAGVYRNGKRRTSSPKRTSTSASPSTRRGASSGRRRPIKQFLAQGDGGVIINLVSTAGCRAIPTSPSTTSRRGRRPT